MRKVLGALLGSALVAGTALATPIESAAPGGSFTVDLQSGSTTPGGSGGRTFEVQNNLDAAPDGAISSTDLTSVWGDVMEMTDPGVVQEFGLTLFNSGASIGELTGATLAVNFYDVSDFTPLGGFVGNVDFSADPLGPGFFSRITFTNVGALNIDLTTTDVFVTQELLGTSGPADTLGVALMNTFLVGFSPDEMYIDSGTLGTGFFTLGDGEPANPGYRVVVPEPASLGLLLVAVGLGLRRR